MQKHLKESLCPTPNYCHYFGGIVFHTIFCAYTNMTMHMQSFIHKIILGLHRLIAEWINVFINKHLLSSCSVLYPGCSGVSKM